MKIKKYNQLQKFTICGNLSKKDELFNIFSK